MPASGTCARPRNASPCFTALRSSTASIPDGGPGPAPTKSRWARAGAAVVAAERGVEVAALRWRRDAAAGLATSQQLGHLVGMNGFLSALVRSARQRRDSQLATWWSERTALGGSLGRGGPSRRLRDLGRGRPTGAVPPRVRQRGVLGVWGKGGPRYRDHPRRGRHKRTRAPPEWGACAAAMTSRCRWASRSRPPGTSVRKGFRGRPPAG